MKRFAIVAIVVLLGLGTAIGLFLWSQSRAEYNQRDATFREAFIEKMVYSLETYYFLNQELPADWQSFRESGVFSYTPEIMNAVIEFGYNDSEGDHPSIDFDRAMYQEAIVIARRRENQWKEELTTDRQRWLDQAGDLRAQLSIFLDPKARTIALTPYLEALRDEHGVPESMLEDLIAASTALVNAEHYRNNPELAIDDPRFIPITKQRAEAEYASSREQILKLIDQIVEKVESNTDKPVGVPDD